MEEENHTQKEAMRHDDASRLDTPHDEAEDAPFSRSLHDLASTASDLLKRVELTRPELSSMVDVLGSWLGAHHGPRLTLEEPVFTVASTDDDRWLVIQIAEDEEKVIASVSAKGSAVEIARQSARAAAGSLVVHRVDGSVQSTYHYGTDACLEIDEEDDSSGVVIPFTTPI